HVAVLVAGARGRARRRKRAAEARRRIAVLVAAARRTARLDVHATEGREVADLVGRNGASGSAHDLLARRPGAHALVADAAAAVRVAAAQLPGRVARRAQPLRADAAAALRAGLAVRAG